MLIADLNRELHSLSPDRLQGLKALIEEKLKSKGTRVTIPSSANELIGAISKYWDCLNFEFARLVVQYLSKEDLQTRLQSYKDDLRKKAELLLTHCRQNRIDPIAPPGCISMKIKMGVDPYSFSLHRILEMKDFLVHQTGMNGALFSGWSKGCITLHFYILGGDMETAVYQLKRHESKLRGMQVVTIEVDGVIVYQDTPSERKSSITAVSNLIYNLADAFEIDGPIAYKLLKFGSAEVAVVGKVQAILREDKIKDIPQAKTAVNHIKLVVEIAYGLLDKVDEIFSYCQSNSMTDVIQGLSYSSPNLQPIQDLMGHLGSSLARAETRYSELVSACNTAICSCSELEKFCKNMAEMSRNKKNATKRIGGRVAGAALARETAATAAGELVRGYVASAVATFVIIAGLAKTTTAAGVGTAVMTHHNASEYQKTEAAFRSIRSDFDALLHFAHGIKEGGAQVHTTLMNVARQVEIVYNVDWTNISLIKDSVMHLNTVCIASYGHTSKIKEYVRIRIEELQAI